MGSCSTLLHHTCPDREMVKKVSIRHVRDKRAFAARATGFHGRIIRLMLYPALPLTKEYTIIPMV